MKFRSSLSARILSVAMTIGVSGSAIAVAAGASPWHLLPYLILLGIGGGIVSLVLAVEDFPAQVALLSVVLPMALWPYVIALLWIADNRPELGWAVAVIGTLPVAITLFAGREDVRARASSSQTPRSAHG